MIISRKLAFMVICAFAAQVTFPNFDAIALKTEFLHILNFVDELYKYDTQEAKNVAKLLQKAIRHNECYGKSSLLIKADIIEIAKTIISDINIDEKVTIINKKMIEAKKREAAEYRKGVISMILCVACIGFMFAFPPVKCSEIEIEEMFDTFDRHIINRTLNHIQARKDFVQI